MGRENKDAKARRLLVEGRVIVDWVNLTGQFKTAIRAKVRGDSGQVYEVTFDMDRFDWLCPCEARGVCAHVLALQLISVQPQPGQGGTFPA